MARMCVGWRDRRGERISVNSLLKQLGAESLSTMKSRQIMLKYEKSAKFVFFSFARSSHKNFVRCKEEILLKIQRMRKENVHFLFDKWKWIFVFITILYWRGYSGIYGMADVLRTNWRIDFSRALKFRSNVSIASVSLLSTVSVKMWRRVDKYPSTSLHVRPKLILSDEALIMQ